MGSNRNVAIAINWLSAQIAYFNNRTQITNKKVPEFIKLGDFKRIQFLLLNHNFLNFTSIFAG